jgi:hypothetical protein
MNAAIVAPLPPAAAGRLLWTGRILSGLLVAFFVIDGALKVVALGSVVEATTKLGYSVAAVRPMGAVLLIATVLYTLPRTAVLGALALTAYLGGATATMVLARQPFYFPVVFGVLVWASLAMRRPQLTTSLAEI